MTSLHAPSRPTPPRSVGAQRPTTRSHRALAWSASLAALAMVLATASLLTASAVCAQEPTPHAEPEEPHHGESESHEGGHEAHEGEHEAAHKPWVAGLKAVQLTSIGEGEAEFGVGGGFSFERDVVHHWVEAELVAAVVVLGEELVVPADLVLKKPFHFGIFAPYIGAGLALTILPEEGEVFVGGSLVGGSYFWLWGDIGLDLEVEFNVIQEEELIQEIVVGLGPSVRF